MTTPSLLNLDQRGWQILNDIHINPLQLFRVFRFGPGSFADGDVNIWVESANTLHGRTFFFSKGKLDSDIESGMTFESVQERVKNGTGVELNRSASLPYIKKFVTAVLTDQVNSRVNSRVFSAKLYEICAAASPNL